MAVGAGFDSAASSCASGGSERHIKKPTSISNSMRSIPALFPWAGVSNARQKEETQSHSECARTCWFQRSACDTTCSRHDSQSAVVVPLVSKLGMGSC